MKLVGGDWNPTAAQVSDKPAAATGSTKGKKATPDPYKRPTLQSMDADSVGLIASKLSKRENLIKVQKAEIDEKNGKLDKLQKELEILKLIKGDHQNSEFQKILNERKDLEKENKEMKQLLLDNGLKWVGKDNPVSEAKTKLQKELDLEIVAKRIEELNIIAERDAKPFVNKDGAHQFSRPDPLPIGFYKNGVIIKGYKFHEYTSKEGQTLLEDILEGYFPYEIKGKYPDGTTFKIIDHTEESYDPKAYEKKDNLQTIEKLDEQFRSYTKEEFLNQLPERVIKHGKIVPIRSEIAKKMGVLQEGGTGGIIEVDTDVVLKEKKGTKFEQGEVTSIKIRSEKGKYSFVVKVLAKDGINTVYKYAEKYSENKGTFVLRKNFPQEEFPRSETRTLRELGLYPSAALIMQ